MSTTPIAAPATLQEAARIVILDPPSLSFTWLGSHLRLTIADSACWMRVSIQRCFPLRRPRSHYSVRDLAQKEIGLLVDPSLLDTASQQAIEHDLQRRYLITEITRIHGVRDRIGVLEWEVETNRGALAFITRDLRDHAIRVASGHWILADVEGRRYQISDVAALDRHSAALVALHL